MRFARASAQSVTKRTATQGGCAVGHQVTARRPCLIDFRADRPGEPVTAHVTWDQISTAAASILRVDTDRLDVGAEGVTINACVLSGRGRHS